MTRRSFPAATIDSEIPLTTTVELSLPERAVLVALMNLVTEVSNPEIKARYGFVVEKKDRERLIALGLISAYLDRSRKGAYVHELTEKGWRICHAELAAQAPSGSHKAYRLMYDTNNHYAAFMKRANVAMADVFIPPPDDIDAPEPTENPSVNSQPIVSANNGIPAPVRITETYTELATESGSWVSLTRLRAALDFLPRAEFDAALRELAAKPATQLIPEANQKTLTEADRAAAIHLGGEDKHLIAIDKG
ncbi:hypothetical protein TL08_19040 [Actinoalloteichus hymeniacidonis]|uniref:Uncharacterized protein n=1 Tax=Actinoalloteichus hymeniacidonis TaxID=340345 RepID=A0AAC9HSM1_9PSEU|nr:hypothetical protein TL08_19040 [Actinoalloteichus hymeniacidonis]